MRIINLCVMYMNNKMIVKLKRNSYLSYKYRFHKDQGARISSLHSAPYLKLINVLNSSDSLLWSKYLKFQTFCVKRNYAKS